MKYRHLLQFLGCIGLTIGLTACNGGDNGQRPSGNASLTALTVAQATLNPAFAPGTLNYTAAVTGGTATTTVTPVTADSRARVTVNGAAVVPGSASAPIALAVGDTTITMVVTAENGAQRTYTVVVTRPPPGSNARLSDLALTAGPLLQIFDPALADYDAAFGYLAASTRVLATPEDPFATLTFDGRPFDPARPSAYQTLTIGADTVTVDVLAEDGVTSAAYTVATSRAPLATLANETYLKASATDPDRFGSTVAIAADSLLVGAPLEQSSATGTNGNDANNSLNQAGAAYLFDRGPGGWAQTAYLKASNTNSGDRFGASLALTRNRAVIGAPLEQSLATTTNGNESDNSGTNVGAAYVFEPGAGGWAQSAYLKAANAESGDDFGRSVAAAGNFVVAGAPLEKSAATGVDGNAADNSLAGAGAAYLFAADGLGGWTQAAYLKASNTDANDQFGNAVTISQGTLVVSAWLEDSDATGVDGNQASSAQADSGAAYVFEQSLGSWAQSAYLKASNTGAGDRFGAAAAIDGDLLAIGASREDSSTAGINGNQQDNSLVDAGAVYVFSRLGGSQWTQEAYLKASNPGPSDRFGASVAIRGNLLVVGAPGERSSATGINGNQNDESRLDSGAIYVFERSAAGVWSQIAYVKASNTGSGDGFGTAVAFDGDTLVSGAPLEQSADAGITGNQGDDSLNQAGAVYTVR